MEGKPLNQTEIKRRGPLKGGITPPSDKSISHRAIIISSLAKGKSRIKNFLRAEDTLRTLEAFKQMGIKIIDEDGVIIVNGKGLNGLLEPENSIECGNSGTTMRLLSGVLAGQPFEARLTGDSSLQRRPMQRIIDPLSKMGAEILSEKGEQPPLTIMGGNLKPEDLTLPIASAQVKSAILFAGLYCDGVTSVTGPARSRDHTERMLRAAGVEVEEIGQKVSVTGIATLKPMDITIPADFSSAAFFIVAGLIIPGSEILIKNVGINPTRIGLISILQDMMGNHIELLNVSEISGEPVADILVKHSKLKGIDAGSNRILSAIDEFPILCVAAAAASGKTKITGAKELRIKESDRISSMAQELQKMGAEVKELDDGIIIKGREKLKPATINSHGDHRVAMAMSIAGLLAEGKTTVKNTDCINTSFPGFFSELEKLME
ncbi:3-phosphoshikimate 1-carboxyvinyltransferase [bacterium BMS3Abin10]|nr:3-phosphoshikimate 1-carboxyvinyltransferase [bacterium BMS3Abin10]GBE37622.1 3-phosphoshikimate 1-carboxyvinyltransferase [bacterium BMS3Bbin08]HDH50425.1 3-phosphoshikimate 1-carboxyvinyltransferase [Nitrospirota bacterium]HDK41110.1 3-phosphoshikimate 1-carboxyvinyltransferase [Nitrospirota bacterium]